MANDNPRAFDDVVTGVGNARPHLVDAWEATALIESFGYTDARVKRDFGLDDTRALGECVFDRLSGRRVPVAAADAADDETRPALRDAIGASWICAIPW